MDRFIVYILYSPTYDKKYIGFTSNLHRRLRSHNFLSKKGYTKKYRPWEVIHLEYFDTKTEARRREKFLKTGKGRSWIKDNITFPSSSQ